MNPWKWLWNALYKRNVRAQIEYIEIHLELMKEAGFIVVDAIDGNTVEIGGIKISYHSLIALHRAAIRVTQVQLLLIVPIFSAIAWMVSTLLYTHSPKFF